MSVVNFIIQNIDNIVLVAALIIAILFMVKRGETAKLKEILFVLVTEAEQQYGDGTGVLKYSAVAGWIYERIPTCIQFLFTAKDIEKMIEAVLSEAKEKWSKNDSIKYYIENPSAIVSSKEIKDAVTKIAETAIDNVKNAEITE